ncbi:MAG: hypothetical protein NT178_16980, partial [Proteobacteria bacterium]|nr:hypothetical protein [Pseudomonadota bacterium]
LGMGVTFEEIFHFFRDRGFVLNNIKTTNDLGNNQFVFARDSDVGEIMLKTWHRGVGAKKKSQGSFSG